MLYTGIWPTPRAQPLIPTGTGCKHVPEGGPRRARSALVLGGGKALQQKHENSARTARATLFEEYKSERCTLETTWRGPDVMTQNLATCFLIGQGVTPQFATSILSYNGPNNKSCLLVPRVVAYTRATSPTHREKYSLNTCARLGDGQTNHARKAPQIPT